MVAEKDCKITISSFCKNCQEKIVAEIKVKWGSGICPRVQCSKCQEIFDVKLVDEDGYPFLNLKPIPKQIGSAV